MRKNLAMACLSLFVLAGAASMLSACNTTEGAGKDVSAAGNAVSNSAERNKPYR
jgi:entericidin B